MKKSKLKFSASNRNGNLIAYVHSDPKTHMLLGVKEDSDVKKSICLLAEHLQGKVEEGILYDVEIKPMLHSSGYVVMSAVPAKFSVEIVEDVLPKVYYKVIVQFGNRKFYYDPLGGKSTASRTMAGVIDSLKARVDIANIDQVISDFVQHAKHIQEVMAQHGYIAY